MRETYQFSVFIEASHVDEADAIMTNLVTGRTFAHEVDAHVQWEFINGAPQRSSGRKLPLNQ
jgi:hypothetical protein